MDAKPMRMVAFKGATAWEWQIGRLYGRVLLPGLWCRRNLTNLIRLGWDNSKTEED